MNNSSILLDNIVFELQKVGGISKIWQKKIIYFREKFDYCMQPRLDSFIYKISSDAVPSLRLPLKSHLVSTLSGQVYQLQFPAVWEVHGAMLWLIVYQFSTKISSDTSCGNFQTLARF